MARSRRNPDTVLTEAMLQQPERFSFFQAVRLLQLAAGRPESVGGAAAPKEEVVRFRAAHTAHRAEAEIAEISPPEGAGGPFRMTVNFLGLNGPVGVLPSFVEDLISEEMERGETDFRDFRTSS